MSNRLFRRSNIIAQEVIDQQDNSFGIQIESIVTKITADLEGDYSTHVTALETLIYNRLGLKVELVTTSFPALILVTPPNISNVLTLRNLKNLNPATLNEIASIDKDQHGFIDLKKAKVGGVFSKHKNTVFINFKILTQTHKLTDAEVTALILHELGHAFTCYEYADRLESSNQVLTNVARSILGNKEDKFTYTLKELKSLDDNVTEEDVETIINGNKIIASYKLYKLVIGNMVSNSSSGIYDKTAMEQLADQFATRFGYGRQEIFALEKLELEFRKSINSSKNVINMVLVTLYGTLLASVIITIAAGGLPFAIANVLILSVVFGLGNNVYTESLRVTGDKYQDYNYDEIRVRYKRIRNEFVDMLKDANLPKEDAKNILVQIQEIDSVINSVGSYKTLFNSISNALFKENRLVKKEIDEQKLLEDLAHNDLFLKAAEFKTI
jgi:hypothetical protein